MLTLKSCTDDKLFYFRKWKFFSCLASLFPVFLWERRTLYFCICYRSLRQHVIRTNFYIFFFFVQIYIFGYLLTKHKFETKRALFLCSLPNSFLSIDLFTVPDLIMVWIMRFWFELLFQPFGSTRCKLGGC